MASTSPLNEMALRKLRNKLAKIQLLLAEPDARMSSITKKLLHSFGFETVHVAKSGDRAVNIIKKHAIDLVITEWPMEPMSGIDFVSFMRTAEDSPKRNMPIIMLTGHADIAHVEKARDAGVTEYLVKPFTAKTLSHRIIQVIDNPRSFIRFDAFAGPDRRRRAPLPPGGADRRLPAEEMEKTARKLGDRTIYHVHGMDIEVRPPDYSLRQKLDDMAASDILNEENVRRAQEVLTHARGDFVEWVLVDLNQMEHAYEALAADLTDEKALDDLRELAFGVKAQAGTFSFPLGSEVGKSLVDFLHTIDEMNKFRLLVIRKHIDTLYVIFHQRLQERDAEVRDEIMQTLHALVHKFS